MVEVSAWHLSPMTGKVLMSDGEVSVRFFVTVVNIWVGEVSGSAGKDKPGGLGLIPRTHVKSKGRMDSPKLSSDPPEHHVPTHITHIQTHNF